MTRRAALARTLLLAVLVGLGSANPLFAAHLPDPDVVRLSASLAALDADPALADKAALERFKARQSLAALQAARSRNREHALVLAAAWVEAAQDAAQAEQLNRQAMQLDRDRDQILVEATRREAEASRREADRLRLQSLAREEEAQRQAESMDRERLALDASAASAEAVSAQASQTLKLADARARETELARKEAALAAAMAGDSLEVGAAPPPSRRSGNRTIYTLPGTAFATGSARLLASGQASLRQLASLLGRKKSISVEAHTDSQGAEAANLLLSQKRADAVRQQLLGAGLDAARVRAVGKGEADPVQDNGSATGRARNRRVEVIVE